MRRAILFLLGALLGLVWLGLGLAEEPAAPPKAKTWWEKREDRKDINYPHNAHLQVMEEEGDSCMLCHGFGPSHGADVKTLKPLTTISNEPLKAVCHNCHVDEKRGPWRCTLCHDDKTKIWPADHNFGYIEHHGEQGRRDEVACRECHLDLAFCTDCHFRRDTKGTGYHPLAYRSLHGIEARLDTLSCGRCHNTPYCDDCHRSSR
jgi:hypothetical protein